MKVENWDGSQETKEFDLIEEMMKAAAKKAKDPNVKKITLLFPKKRKAGKN